MPAKLYARGPIEKLSSLAPTLENFADDGAATEKIFEDGDDSDNDHHYVPSENEEENNQQAAIQSCW